MFTKLALAAMIAVAAKTYSCPIAGDSQRVFRLAWVEPGQSMRSGAVIVGGDHLAGERPTDDQAVVKAYQDLKTKYHVGAVVNLRSESAEDAAAAKLAGMKFLHLPIADGSAPTPAQVEAFFTFHDAARAKKTVVLWHCAGGIGRTGVLAGMLRLRAGWSAEDAAKEMFAMGLNDAQAVEHLPALNDFAKGLGKPAWWPAGWATAKASPYNYQPLAKKLARPLR